MHRMLINAKQNDYLPEVGLSRLPPRPPVGRPQAPGGPPPDAQIPLGTATIGPFYEHQTIVFFEEYYTWHTWLPMG